MFTKILIANRGEIACRIIGTARKLGIFCVAVYSDADAGARHVAMADEAVNIGGPVPADSYLMGDAIIAAALKSGAQAIHPGYGFLSENPDFVDAVSDAGLVFVGPSAKAIRAMGLKDAAKLLMEKTGVPVVPGYHGQDQNAKILAQQAENIGYPVLIKAVAGGGGKGMRQVEAPAEFASALASAKSEALASFGNDAVLIEKFVDKPRHIEVQIFGDGENCIHLFERDCSLQRRHQKVIEEAPAPGMTTDMRTAMCAAAVKAAQAINYKGAGTVEFIVDASDGLRADRFWFMEMNTRLQVEHPVTEAVTGVDLVEWQLRVAAGELLPLRQDQIALTGHAFEARLYAEDAENGFLPVTGTLTHLSFPDTARIDTGVGSGDAITPFYDPMIAKITVSGPTRQIALNQLNSALSKTEIAGTVTNLTFLGKLARQSEFVSGDVDTGLIGRILADLTVQELPPSEVKALALLTTAGLGVSINETSGFALWGPLRHQINLVYRDQEFCGSVALDRPGAGTVKVDGEEFSFLLDNGNWRLASGHHEMRVFQLGKDLSIFAAVTWHFEIPDPLNVSVSVSVDDNQITAPMPGLIKEVYVAAGALVSTGDPVLVLEAMKMEHVLTAPRTGIIAETLVKTGDQVAATACLMTYQEETE